MRERTLTLPPQERRAPPSPVKNGRGHEALDPSSPSPVLTEEGRGEDPSPPSPSPVLTGEGRGEGSSSPPPIGATNPHARRLRRNSTDAERLLWRHLRNRQLAGHKFRRQATLGPYIVDFLCLEANLVLEADGGQHSDETDAARTAWLESRGLRVVRFWNNDILTNIEGVIDAILIALEEQAPSPSHPKGDGPLPLP